MRNRVHLLRLGMIAADSGRRFAHLLESIAVVGIITVLIAIGIRELQQQVTRTQLSEAFALSSTSKVDILSYRAEYGRWPATAEEAGNGTLNDPEHLSRFVSSINLHPDGAMEVRMDGEEVAEQLSGTSLSLRFLVSDYYSGAPVAQVCGGFPPPPGMHVVGDNRTTVKPNLLPFYCKEH